MDVFEAITTRRSMGRMTQDEVPKEAIQKILESAIHAPNHKITQPWRFHVFTGKGRGELAKARAEAARQIAGEEREEEDLVKGRISRERKKAFRSPVVIAVTSRAGRDEIETLENYAACCAAVQNMLLTAHSLGLGAMWRTGPVSYHQALRDLLGLEAGDHVVAYLYIGYPDLLLKERRREPVESLTTWREG